MSASTARPVGATREHAKDDPTLRNNEQLLLIFERARSRATTLSSINR